MIRFVRKPEYTCPKRNAWKHVKVLQSGKKNFLVQCNCCDKQFWKLFALFATVLPRDAMQARPMSSCGVAVCVSVTFLHSVKMNKHIFKNFLTIG